MPVLAIWFVALLTAAPISLQQSRQELIAEYGRRYKEIDQKSVDQLLGLAQWCSEKELKTYANLLYRKVLKLEPQHPEANRAIGNVEVGGRWYPPAEAAAARAKLAAADRAAAEAALAAAKTRHRDAVARALTEGRAASQELRDAYVRAVAAQGSYAAAMTAHVVLVARASPEDTDRYAQIGEWVHHRLSEITFGKEDAGVFDQDGGRHIFYLVEPTLGAATMRFVGRQHPAVASYYDLEKQAEALQTLGLEFTTFHRPPCLVHLRVETQSSAVANTMARSFVQHTAKAWSAEPMLGDGGKKETHPMAWLLEGVGAWASLMATGRNEVYRIKSRYARRFVTDEEEPPNYPEMALSIVTDGRAGGFSARSFPQLCRARLENWNDADLAMSFALVDYLIRGRVDDWRSLIQELRGAESFRVAFVRSLGNEADRQALADILTKADDRSLDHVFAEVAERFEREWRVWVRATYPIYCDEPGKMLADAPFPDIR